MSGILSYTIESLDTMESGKLILIVGDETLTGNSETYFRTELIYLFLILEFNPTSYYSKSTESPKSPKCVNLFDACNESGIHGVSKH